MSDNQAQIEITATSSRLEQGLRTAWNKFKTFGALVGRGMAAVNKHMEFGKAASHAAGFVVGGLALRGIDKAKEIATDVYGFEKALVRLQSAAMKTPGDMQHLRGVINGLSRDIAVDRNEMLHGARALVDLAGASALTDKAITTIGRTAKATDSELGDIVTMTFALKDALKVTDAELESTMAGIHEQSKEGSVHFNKMAGEFIALAPKFARFGKVGRAGAIELGAMFQVVRRGFKSPEEVTTGIEGIFKGLIRHADKFQKAGVRVFDKDRMGVKHLRALADIFRDIEKSKLAKDPQKMIKAFGRGEGEAAFRLLMEHHKEFNRLVELGNDELSIEHDLNTYLESDAGKIDKALNGLKVTVAETFTPERIKAFANALVEISDTVGPMAEGFMKIAGVFGGLYGVGKSVRGFLSTNANNNPWKGSAFSPQGMQQQMDAAILAGGDQSTPEAKGRLLGAQLRKANREAYDAAVEEIMGGEVNDRTTPESIKRAVLASMASQSMPGGVGKFAAGERYLQAAGVSSQQAQEIYAKAMREAMEPIMAKLGPILRDALAGLDKPVEVKVDSDTVAKANSKAAHHRRRVH